MLTTERYTRQPDGSTVLTETIEILDILGIITFRRRNNVGTIVEQRVAIAEEETLLLNDEKAAERRNATASLQKASEALLSSHPLGLVVREILVYLGLKRA